MYDLNNRIKFEKFINKKDIKKDFLIPLFFSVLFLITGAIEKNLILIDNGLGLLEHINIWIFLGINFILPVIIYVLFNNLKNTIEQNIFSKLENIFNRISRYKLITFLTNFFTIIGFCCFIGNTLQNANIINQLSFDYWDSINYKGSYIISRLYKFYLFVYFIPHILIYVFVLIKSISELLVINDSEIEEYPIKNYESLNILCNFGLNILLTILLPFILISSGVYLVHSRFDITTATTLIISIMSALTGISMYILLINKFYTSITKYRKKNIEQINFKLAEIHKYIFNSKFDEESDKKLEIYLKKETYLCQVKEKINKLSKFPLIIKAIFTSTSPLIPLLLKFLFQFLKTFFKLEILDIIL